MTIGLFGGIINIILDYLFIFGIEGRLLPMGVQGAALGSVIAQAFMLIVSLILFQKFTPYKIIFQKKIILSLKTC